jgi:hypothetical protein
MSYERQDGRSKKVYPVITDVWGELKICQDPGTPSTTPDRVIFLYDLENGIFNIRDYKKAVKHQKNQFNNKKAVKHQKNPFNNIDTLPDEVEAVILELHQTETITNSTIESRNCR